MSGRYDNFYPSSYEVGRVVFLKGSYLDILYGLPILFFSVAVYEIAHTAGQAYCTVFLKIERERFTDELY
jgi:hypothetical protein